MKKTQYNFKFTCKCGVAQSRDSLYWVEREVNRIADKSGPHDFLYPPHSGPCTVAFWKNNNKRTFIPNFWLNPTRVVAVSGNRPPETY